MADTVYRIMVVRDTENDGAAYLDRGPERDVTHLTLDDAVKQHGEAQVRTIFEREMTRITAR